MEKLLEILADHLFIWNAAEVRKEVLFKEKMSLCDNQILVPSEDVKRLFRREFMTHFYKKREGCKLGTEITYIYWSQEKEANQNMKEVLDKLPELPKGQEYVLSLYTELTFHVSVNGRSAMTLSPWLTREYLSVW